MTNEVIIMAVFLAVLFISVPLVIYLINRDTKRMEKEALDRQKQQALENMRKVYPANVEGSDEFNQANKK
jgi:uncharacterized membrane protein